MFASSFRPFAPLTLLLLPLVLAGCETVSRSGPTQQVAVVEDDKQGTSSINIASLPEVTRRNPRDPSAYNPRGAAQARSARYSEAIADFTKALQLAPS